MKAYNESLGDLGLVFLVDIRDDVRNVGVNIQEVHTRINNLPSQIVEVLSENRFVLKIPRYTPG